MSMAVKCTLAEPRLPGLGGGGIDDVAGATLDDTWAWPSSLTHVTLFCNARACHPSPPPDEQGWEHSEEEKEEKEKKSDDVDPMD